MSRKYTTLAKLSGFFFPFGGFELGTLKTVSHRSGLSGFSLRAGMRVVMEAEWHVRLEGVPVTWKAFSAL